MHFDSQFLRVLGTLHINVVQNFQVVGDETDGCDQHTLVTFGGDGIQRAKYFWTKSLFASASRALIRKSPRFALQADQRRNAFARFEQFLRIWIVRLQNLFGQAMRRENNLNIIPAFRTEFFSRVFHSFRNRF